jgi:transcriptional regulator with XRE-family HTH domain
MSDSAGAKRKPGNRARKQSKLQAVFITNLKEARKRAGLTQEEIASKVALSVKFYANIEQGVKFPSLSSIERLSMVFGVPPYRLFMELQPEQSTPVADLLESYNMMLEEQYRQDLSRTRKQFLEKVSK